MAYYAQKSSTGKRKSRSDEDVNGDGYIDAPSSRKILAISQDLADEDEEDRKAGAKAVAPNPAFAYDSRFGDEDSDAEGTKAASYDDEEDWMPDEDVTVDDIDLDDLAVYKKFLPNEGQFAEFAPSIANLSTIDRRKDSLVEPEMLEEEGETTNLADLILQRIAEKEALTAARSSGRPVVHGGGSARRGRRDPSQRRRGFLRSGCLPFCSYPLTRRPCKPPFANIPCTQMRPHPLAIQIRPCYLNHSRSSLHFLLGTHSFPSRARNPGLQTQPLPQPKSSSLPSPPRLSIL